MRSSYISCILILFFSCVSYGLEDTNFDESSNLDFMQKYSITFDEPSESSDLKLRLLRETYERNKPSKMSFSKTLLIPKKIHSIWLGNSPLPKNKQYYLETWRKFHPDWEVKLWTDQDLLKENFPNTDLYLLAESYQEKSDIMRYEIVRRYGGLYIDSDIECFSNFDEMHHKYKFYGYMETPVVNKMVVNILNGMFAAAPNHPIINQTLDKIRKNWDEATLDFERKYSTSDESFKRSRHFMAVTRTMYPFGNVIYDYLQKENIDKMVIFPAGYGFPIYYVNKQKDRGVFKNLFSPRAILSYNKIIRPETLSFHYYEKENSLMEHQNFGESLFKQNFIPDKVKNYVKKHDKYFMNLSDLFDRNFPTEIQYEPIAQIPEVIYIYNQGNLSEQKLVKLQDEWQKKNKFFTVKVLSDAELESFLPEKIKFLNSDIKRRIACFYLLNQNGGVYVESNFEPANLQEFNYKYAFYGKLKNLFSVFNNLSMDFSFIASRSNSNIITHFIDNFENEVISSKTITDIQVSELYLESVYKYNQLDGKNIVFPEVVFDQKR